MASTTPYNLASAFAGLQIQPSISLTSPSNTDISVADTIHKMRSIARASVHSGLVRTAVNDAVKELNTTSTDRDICKAIFYWIKSHVAYVEDEQLNMTALGMDSNQAIDTELLITPDTLLNMQYPMGDCDDFSTLCASMLLMLGFKVAFVTIAADGDLPTVLSHVYVKTWLDDENKGLYMDCSHGPYVGWEHDQYTRKVEWPI